MIRRFYGIRSVVWQKPEKPLPPAEATPLDPPRSLPLPLLLLLPGRRQRFNINTIHQTLRKEKYSGPTSFLGTDFTFSLTAVTMATAAGH